MKNTCLCEKKVWKNLRKVSIASQQLMLLPAPLMFAVTNDNIYLVQHFDQYSLHSIIGYV